MHLTLVRNPVVITHVREPLPLLNAGDDRTTTTKTAALFASAMFSMCARKTKRSRTYKLPDMLGVASQETIDCSAPWCSVATVQLLHWSAARQHTCEVER
jgi:hypothetical protein